MNSVMIDFKELDHKIQHGYLLILENQWRDGCDEWLQTWECIKLLMKESNSKDLYDLDEKYPWTESGTPSEYVEDMKTELYAASVKDMDYQQKYNTYCQELAVYISDGTPEDYNKRYTLKLKNELTLHDISDEDLAKYITKKEPEAPLTKRVKTGRNEPCPCGSGRKYKKCCGVKMVG